MYVNNVKNNELNIINPIKKIENTIKLMKEEKIIQKGKSKKTKTKSKSKSKSKSKKKHLNDLDQSESHSPYIFRIKKMNESPILLNDKTLLSFSKKLSPMSGSEPEWNPKIWNQKESIRTTHNCYSYALGKVRSGLESKAQPGYASGDEHINDDSYDCKTFYDRLHRDVPGSYLEKFDNVCHPGFYKIFLMLDPGNDYHWARQDSRQLWSHKPGSTECTDKDANGNLIENPLKSSWKYESLNYHKPCFFACVYSDLSRSMSKIY